MEQEIKIRFSIDGIEEKSFELSSSIPHQIDAGSLQVRYLIETEILRTQEKARVMAGVKYSTAEDSLCELIISMVFMVEPFADIIKIDEAKNTVSFTKEIIPTLLNITFGTLRGVLFEKTKGTALAGFPLPPVSMPKLVEMNRFRVVMDREQ